MNSFSEQSKYQLKIFRGQENGFEPNQKLKRIMQLAGRDPPAEIGYAYGDNIDPVPRTIVPKEYIPPAKYKKKVQTTSMYLTAEESNRRDSIKSMDTAFTFEHSTLSKLLRRAILKKVMNAVH